MATFTFTSANRAFWGRDFNAYRYSPDETDTMAVFEFDTSRAPFDPNVFAWRIELDMEGLQTYVVGDGPRAGEEMAIAGTITGARWYDQSGALMLSATGLSVDIPTVDLLLESGRGQQVWQLLVQGNDVFNGSDNSNGPYNGDEIQTGFGRDTVHGNGGDDYISDQGGKDSYFGGDGFDQLSYAEGWWWDAPQMAVRGLDVDLQAGRIRGPDDVVDLVQGIESIRGTHLRDRFLGDAGNNQFFGLAGADRIDGAGGFDEVRYDRDIRYFGTDGIKANLAKGWVIDGFGLKDRLFDIEAVRGTDQRDSMVDDGGDNRFRGLGGNDKLTVKGGNDTLQGGAGRDTFIFSGNAFGTDVIEDFSQVDGDRIRIAAASGLEALSFSQDGTTAVITLNAASQVRVLNFDADAFEQGDFIF